MSYSPQSGIIPEPSQHSRYIVLKVKDLKLDTLKERLADFETTRARLLSQYPESKLSTVVSFGGALWQRLGQKLPAGYHELAPLTGQGTAHHFVLPATGGDLMIYIHAERADLCFLMSQTLLHELGNEIEVMDERTGFRYLDRRDLTGFIDGTENPAGDDDRIAVALLDESAGAFAASSFAFSQRYVHDLSAWQKLKVDAQEAVIGRSKLESIEQPDGIKRTNSHIARVVIEDENGEELEILRTSAPYGDGGGEKGLFFHAYTRDLTIIDRMLARMYGKADEVGDRLLNFVTPVSGAYFFAPSQELLNQAIGAD